MAKIVFKSYNPNDNLLLPPCLGDYLPQNHPARVVSAIVDRLDISEILSGYAGGGTSSYNPRMLLKIIVYAYLNNVYSGRQMEKLLVENIAYMWLSGMQTPDFRTINIFRSKRLANKFDDIFTQIVLLLHDEGLVSLKVQYIDGTKIESVANKYIFVWKGSTEKNKAKLENNVREVLKAAETALAMENAEEKKELSSAEMAKRADRILKKMDENGGSERSPLRGKLLPLRSSAHKNRRGQPFLVNLIQTIGRRVYLSYNLNTVLCAKVTTFTAKVQQLSLYHFKHPTLALIRRNYKYIVVRSILNIIIKFLKLAKMLVQKRLIKLFGIMGL